MAQFLDMLVVAICAPIVVALIQAMLFRVAPDKAPQAVTMVAMVLGYPAIFAISALVVGGISTAFEYTYVFLLYSFAAYTYFHVFNMSETSRRIRMLAAIAQNGSTNLQVVDAIFDERDMMQARLNRLVALGQIERRDGVYVPKGLAFPLVGEILYRLSALFGTPWTAIEKWKKTPKRNQRRI